MNARKYTAPTMEAALAKVKSDLGRDAVILHTRCYRTGGILGLGGREVVEVTASSDVNVAPRRPRAAAGRTGAQEQAAAVSTASATAVAPGPLERAYRQGAAPTDDLMAIKSDIAGVRAVIEDLVKQTRPSRTALWSEQLKGWYRHLTTSGVSEGRAVSILEPLAAKYAGSREVEPAALTKAVLSRVAESVQTGAPIAPGRAGAPTVVALVGPTGVGKTTTIAKLAAHFAIRERKPVGLVTLDTYRIAAVEQLRTYARIIDVPLEVALSPAELPEALARLSQASVIFVDTAGRSQRDRMKMNDLRAFFEKRRPDQVHLVLSAAAERETLSDIVEKFSVYEPDRILVTKVDELPAYGRLLDVAALAGRPVSYITTGQDVPDDIETARPERIAALVAGEAGLDG